VNGNSSLNAERSGFYGRTLRDLVNSGVLDEKMSILVGAGGVADRNVFVEHGFRDVTITNVDETMTSEDCEPYRWERQDVEALTYPDEAFDWAVVSAGLHHCRSPHRGLLELYRVARRGVLAIESRDSALMRAAIRVGVIDEYELEAVAANAFRSGGVRNTPVPNYVYRWTEREVQKTIASHAPHARHTLLWFHELELPLSLFDVCAGRRRRGIAWALQALEPSARALVRLFPSQANLFGFAILKPRVPGDLQPWLRDTDDGPAPDRAWIQRRLSG
jgi:SAM-dependent methyltransferase